MVRFQSFLPYLALFFAASAYAAIGPVADLVISNADVTPDGFTRAAVVVNEAFPSPLITGYKVSLATLFVCNIPLLICWDTGRPFPTERHQ